MLCISDGCDYFYNQVPNDTCNIMKGGSANFNCDIRGTCNTFSVLWFKNTNMHITNGYEQISQSDGPSGKYKVLTSGPRAAANDHCNFGTTLIINRFNHSDNGYYWCQIVSNNSCPLRPSPHGYVAVGETMNEPSCTFERQLPRPICAEDATFQMTEGMGCISESISLNSTIKLMPTVINPYSIHIYNINSTTLMATSMVNSHDTSFDREENMVWVYGLVTVCLLVIIVLVLSLVIVSVKCRTQQKQSKHNA